MNPGFDWLALAEFSAIGVLSGGLLALVALGFVLIYKGTGVINFAMGEFMMLGAYFLYTAHVMWGLPLWMALPATLAAVALCAALVERAILRPLSGQPVISVDTKNKEIETEEHMKQITERQSGRLKNEIEKLDNRIADQ